MNIQGSIRQAVSGDLDGLLSLYEHLHTADETPARATLEKVWAEILAAPRHFVFVAEEEGALLATCVLQIVPNLTRGARPYGLIENVVTRQDKRGQGHGNAVMKHAMDRAWQDGCYKVMLLTSREDPKVLGFYEKLGFKQGVKKGFIARAPEGS